MIRSLLLVALLCFAQDVLKVNVETVQVHTTVTDLKGRFVTGLEAKHFTVAEDGKRQQIDSFSADDAPLSIGILIDVTGTMGRNLPLARQAALTFLRAGNLANEYFVIESSNPKVAGIDGATRSFVDLFYALA